MYGSLTAGTKPYSAIERCMVAHDGSELETKIERKNGFQSDPSIKHIKVDTAVCSITKGNDKKALDLMRYINKNLYQRYLKLT